jgi:hypothetical protein
MASSPPTLITPKFVFGYPLSPNVSDYRCVVNADATAVIVERTVLNAEGHGTPELYIVDLASRTATPFLKVVNDIPIGNTTRPDWCWRTGQVAFNYTKSPRVGVVDATGVDPRVFPNTANMDYPTWFPDGETLATESGQGSPNPNTTTLDPKTGTIIAQALEGTNLYGGMPSVNPAYPNLIAFAGQPVGSPYDQDMNYIWVKDLSSPVPAVPLEYNAPATGDFCPAFQGRAPGGRPTANGWSSNRTGVVCQAKCIRTACTPSISMNMACGARLSRSPIGLTISTTRNGFRTALREGRPAPFSLSPRPGRMGQGRLPHGRTGLRSWT